jgi:hypothetical protein
MCQMHRHRLKRTGTTDLRPRPEPDYAARWWSKVERGGAHECWPWRGTVLDVGYGQFAVNRKRYLAHRYGYELLVGPIPAGLQLDHVKARGCTRTDCVNPAHLEPVTSAENLRRSEAISTINARKTHCSKGHALVKRGADGKRFCRPCKREWERNHRKSRRGRAA